MIIIKIIIKLLNIKYNNNGKSEYLLYYYSLNYHNYNMLLYSKIVNYF